MASVFLVLSLLVFAAGLVAWAVHMRGVWIAEAEQAARHRPARARGPTVAPVSDTAVEPAQTDDPVLEDSRP